MYVLWALGEEDSYVELISYDLNNGDSMASSGSENSTISVSYIHRSYSMWQASTLF